MKIATTQAVEMMKLQHAYQTLQTTIYTGDEHFHFYLHYHMWDQADKADTAGGAGSEAESQSGIQQKLSSPLLFSQL